MAGAPKGNNSLLAREVVSLIELESLPLNKACEKVGIPRGSFYLELKNDEELFDIYTRAREIRADNIFEEILQIADSQENDVTIVDGVEVTNHNAISRNRLQIDARKWMLGKMSAKYSDNQKIDLTTNGKDLPAVNPSITVEIVKPKDE